MAKESQPKPFINPHADKKGLVDPNKVLNQSGREEVILGQNFDGTLSTLPAYVEIDGVQVHPDRVEEYLKKLG